jgi:hypothetical protein
MIGRWNMPCACGLILACVLTGFAPGAAAIKIERDKAPPELPGKVQQAAQAPAPELPKLTAEQIAERNVQARGGLKAWRAIQSIQMTGLLDAGGRNDTRLPFTLQMKRPHYQRVTIEVAGQKAVQVFDGQTGWKLRPYLNRMDVEPFSEEEKFRVLHQDDLDGPLIDYAAKGSRLGLEGTELVEGKANYRLKLTMKDGTERHVWVDGASFLESKIEGNPRRLDGKMRKVENTLRDWRKVEGVLMPFESEASVETAPKNRKMTIEKVVLNPPLEDRLFGKPVAPAGATAAEVMGKAAAARTATAAPASAAATNATAPAPASGAAPKCGVARDAGARTRGLGTRRADIGGRRSRRGRHAADSDGRADRR